MAKAKDYSHLDDRTRYIGLANIANRIGATPSQLRTLYNRDWFPMFKLMNFRRFNGKPMRTIGPPETWYSEEWLIRWWMFKRLQRDVERRREARARTAEEGEKNLRARARQ